MSKKPWPPLRSLSVALFVVIGIPWSFKILLAPPLGGPCTGGFDCAPLHGRCVLGENGRYCTITCESDDACPSSGHCGVPKHDPWRVWFAKSPMSERFCVPGPRPTTPEAEATIPGAVPEAQFGRRRGGEPHAGPEPVAPTQTH
jgi:hypothetical protein